MSIFLLDLYSINFLFNNNCYFYLEIISLNTDFTLKTSIQAKMRVLIRRLLNKYKYPPDAQSKAVELIMEQAMLFGEEWATI